MKTSRIQEIELKTKDILSEVIGDPDKIDPPIDLGKVLEHYKISLNLAHFPDDTIAGAYEKKSRQIYASIDDSPKRQAFTIAHELGHIILHDSNSEIFFRHQATEFNGDQSPEEQEANWFAAALLMPEELVRRFWEHHKDIELLAAFFGVSRTAAFWRLKNLKLID
jgi:Zn-dependent peptidase ImmA (M78 family)